MSKNLKQRTISGMLWNSVQQFGTMFISFVVNIILARLLTPEDFGVIGMIMVFIALSEVFVDGGFASALIQKKAPTNADYSTVFYWNLFVSLVLFILLYITAPFIERFYGMSNLALILRVQGIVLIFNAFNIIQFNQLRKKLRFKELANVALMATIIGAMIGIIMAYLGYGVWSLVVKLLVTSFFTTVFLWLKSNWTPSLVFSRESFRGLFSFGSYVLLTNVVSKLYTNLQSLIIGRVFSAGDLGFYTQANKLQDIPVRGMSTVVNQVTFPVFSSMQDNLERMKRGISKSLKAITFLNFPLMVLLIIIARPLILILFTDKWSESILYFQLLCVGGFAFTMTTINNNIFMSLGKSNVFFAVQLSKRIIGIVLIVVGIYCGGIIGMLWAVALSVYVFYIIGAFFSSKLTGYTIKDQLTDIAPVFFLSIIVGVLVYFIGIVFTFSPIVMLLLQSVVYLSLYVGISYLLNVDAFLIFYDIIMIRLNRKIG